MLIVILDYQQLFWEICRSKMEIDSIMDTNWFGHVSCHLLFISYNDLAFIKNTTLTASLATLVSFESLSQEERKQTWESFSVNFYIDESQPMIFSTK